MKKFTEHCDFCDNEFKNKLDKNGFCIELGYSLGGWGSRKDFTNEGVYEICTNCFKKVKEKAQDIDKTIYELRH